ncbi:MAG: hypothetical protein GF313_09715 [Caldithrix sp.]|nr:hypothetical protein [Caldithrix sp.]
MFTSVDFLPLVIYILILLYLGFRYQTPSSNSDEYLLSSRTLTVPAFVATLVTTWYGGILGIGEFAHQFGIAVWVVFGLPFYVFAILFAIFLAPKIRSAMNVSIPDMLYQTYNKPVGLLGSVFIIFMTSPAPYILMLAVLVDLIFNISFVWSVLMGTVFSVVYVYKGGFRSIVLTDKLQFVFMFAGFTALFGFLHFSELSVFDLPNKLDGHHKDWTGGLSWQNIIVWFLIASWTFIDPGFHQRCAAARNTQTARKGILISVGFWFIFDMLTMVTGLYAYVLLPEIEPLMAYPELALNVLPVFVRGIFFTGLLAIIMSTIDSFTFLSAITFGRDIYGLYKPDNKTDPSYRPIRWGLSLTAVVAVALIFSTPSVVRLWYNLGTLFIPPLLIPVLGSYWSVFQLNGKKVFAMMSASFALTFSSFLWGELHKVDGTAQYFFGVEPFFPGLFLSIVLLLVFKVFNDL